MKTTYNGHLVIHDSFELKKIQHMEINANKYFDLMHLEKTYLHFEYLQSLFKLSQERDYYRRELEGRRGPLTPPDHLQTVHLYSEFNKSKVQVSHLLNEL